MDKTLSCMTLFKGKQHLSVLAGENIRQEKLVPVIYSIFLITPCYSNFYDVVTFEDEFVP